MRMRTLVGRRYKERPAEATLDSHSLLLRGAYARQVANGIYSLLHPGYRVVRKIEAIIRDEMDRVGGQEVLMPVVLPRELWEETGRYQAVGSELLRFKDRTDHDMVLAMTHEEGVVHLARHEAGSYKQYPFMIYQIQTKFRDEPRSRGGLIRVREFTMKDAYSFHRTAEDLDDYYRECAIAYHRIFARAGIPETAVVRSDSGMMGGKIAHEFMLLTDCGEDSILKCDTCRYIANAEVAEGRIPAFPEDPKELEKIHTPGKKTIEDVTAFLSVPLHQAAKVVFYESDSEGRPVMALIRGDLEVNESKLARLVQRQPVPAEEATIRKTGAVPGYASPMGARDLRVIADPTVGESNNLVTGANEDDYHYRNFNLDRDCPDVEIADIATLREGDGCPRCKGALQMRRGIEVGNIFQLGTRYTESMGMSYLDENGQAHTPIMGCYGIGVGRMMSSVMEARHDKFGPIWPISIAPWEVHINAIKPGEGGVGEVAGKLYDDLREAGLEVIFDDRDERPGVQFADADLLGVPLRFIVGAKSLANGNVEWKIRGTDEKGEVPVEEAAHFARKWVDQAYAEIRAQANAKTEPF
ncbi:proline--tRNA ligase [bacterium]|nr:proline--tRNA ligase [bacterium]